MGRTLPTQIQILNDEAEAWKSYRRALRIEDQEAFDDVWAFARRHAMAASMASRLLPFEAHCLSMIVGLQREIINLKTEASQTQVSEGSSPTPALTDFSSREKTSSQRPPILSRRKNR